MIVVPEKIITYLRNEVSLPISSRYKRNCRKADLGHGNTASSRGDGVCTKICENEVLRPRKVESNWAQSKLERETSSCELDMNHKIVLLIIWLEIVLLERRDDAGEQTNFAYSSDIQGSVMNVEKDFQIYCTPPAFLCDLRLTLLQ